MRKVLMFICLIFSIQTSMACEQSTVIYRSEADDDGMTLGLAYSCTSREGDVCIYLGKGMAGMTSDEMNSHELYRRNVSSTSTTLKINLESSLEDSVLDYQFMKFELNKKDLKGILQTGGKGFDPYRGVIIKPTKTIKLSCKKEI